MLNGPSVSREEIEGLRTHKQLDEFADRHNIELHAETVESKRVELIKELCEC